MTTAWEKYVEDAANTPGKVYFYKDNDGIVRNEKRMYNGFNQLVWALVNATKTEYAYRPDGLRKSKASHGFGAGTRTEHLWDGANICADIGADGAIHSRYLRGVNLIARRQDRQNQFFHFNAHGDTVLRTDYQGGVLKSYEYDAFGIEHGTDKDDTNVFRYCSEYFDKETGTYYLRARSYNPLTSRMLSEDTVRFTTKKLPNGQEIINPLSLNLYTYCWNNPLRYVDPSGHDPVFYEVTGKHGGKTWRFLMDNKGINVTMSVFGAIIPFGDNIVYGVTDFITGNKTITQNMYQDITTKIGATFAAASTAADVADIGGATGKVAGAAGKAATLVSIVNVLYEGADNRPYYNEIAGELFRGYYESSSFETTSARFLTYSAITEDLVKQGIITYEASWGVIKNYQVDWDRYSTYFDELGMTAKEIGAMIN